MEFESWIFHLPISLDMPKSFWTWIVWVIGIILILAISIGFRNFIFHVQRRRMWLFLILFFFQPILSLTFCLRIATLTGQDLPVLLLSGVPWILAAGLIGPIPSILLAAVAGIFSALWVSHSIFDPIVFILFALFFNWAVQQNYKSKFFSALRHPVLSSTIGLLLYLPTIIIIQLVSAGNNSINILSKGINQLAGALVPFLVSIFAAVLIAEILYLNKKPFWYRPKTLVVATLDQNSPRKYIVLSIMFGLILISFGFFITWQASLSQINALFDYQLEAIFSSIEEGLPIFINYGRNLLSFPVQAIKENGIINSKDILIQYFEQQVFYREMYLVDENGSVVFHVPEAVSIRMSNEDEARLFDTLGRKAFQLYPSADDEGNSFELTFLSPLDDSGGNLNGFMLARVDLEKNSQAMLLFTQLNSLLKYNGAAVLTDEFGRTVISSNEVKNLDTGDFVSNFTEVSEENDLVKTRILKEPQWRLALTIPASTIMSQARELAVPYFVVLFAIVLVFIIVFYFFVRSYYLRVVNLNKAISRSLDNKSDYQNPLDTVDEIGVLGESIKKMYFQNKEAISDQVALLRTSTAIIQMQELETIVQPVFDALLHKGCDSVRMILSLPGQQKQKLNRGSATSLYNHLDEPVLEAVSTQSNLILPHVVRNRGLAIPAGTLVPGSLAAFSLEKDEKVIGALWIAYQEPTVFLRDDISAIAALKDELQKSIISYSQITHLRQTQLEFESLLHVLPIGLLVIENAGNVRFINQMALDIPGLFASAWKATHYSEVIRNDELLHFLQSESFNSNMSLRIDDVGLFNINLKNYGEQRILLIRNITAEKSEIKLHNDLILTASHDIRSPLTLIKGYVSMLEVVGGLNPQQKTYLDKISLASDQISRISSELLDLQRVNSDSYLKLDTFQISDFIEEIKNTIAPVAGQKNITIVSGGNAEFNLTADKTLLKQALVNLLNNAIEYSAIGKKVELHVVFDGRQCCFQIADQGAGIAPIDLPKLFTPGFRVNKKEDSEFSTSGFGLLIVKFISELHHGRIWAESTLGKGSIFYLEIPQTNDLT